MSTDLDSKANPGIRLLAIQGSARPGNFTAKALRLVTDEVASQHPEVQFEILDPTHLELPLPGTGEPSAELLAWQTKAREATGVILATPEYHGSYSSVMKLVIDNLGFPSALRGKPIALLGVAAGQIGAIKALEHLRSVTSHIGALVLPGPVSVAGVQGVFDAEGHCLDPAIEKRIRGVPTSLLDYIHQNLCPRLALEAMAREGSQP